MSGAPSAAERPIAILIAALGGEGGGVLTNWLVNAATREDYPVQATSIPGVAQRTGATTYYLEIWPAPRSALGGAKPIMALAPSVGEVDLLVSSELLETGRAIQNGFVTPDRTTVIASTHRVLTTREKMAMADGAFDADTLRRATDTRAATLHLHDLDQAARSAGAHINSVMLGAIAGVGVLPFQADALEEGIKAEGKAVEANLRGFRAGLELVGGSQDRPVEQMPATTGTAEEFPQAPQGVMSLATDRLTMYQDKRYADLFSQRMEPFLSGDTALAVAVARHLAVRMSYEDIIRVANLKLAPDRYDRIRAETGAKPGELVRITEFFKPGVIEVADILPPWLARRLLAQAERSPKFAARAWPLELNSTSVWGHLRLRFLGGLRRVRRRTWRYQQEQQAIEAWLVDIAGCAENSTAFAMEVAACANLIKGYGSTHRRGTRNYATIREALIVPVISGAAVPDPAKLAGARDAALADPDGEALDTFLATVPKADGELAAAA